MVSDHNSRNDVMKRGYFGLMIGMIVFFSGITSIQLTAYVGSSGLDYVTYLATIVLTVSGLVIIGGSIMYLLVEKIKQR